MFVLLVPKQREHDSQAFCGPCFSWKRFYQISCSHTRMFVHGLPKVTKPVTLIPLHASCRPHTLSTILLTSSSIAVAPFQHRRQAPLFVVYSHSPYHFSRSAAARAQYLRLKPPTTAMRSFDAFASAAYDPPNQSVYCCRTTSSSLSNWPTYCSQVSKDFTTKSCALVLSTAASSTLMSSCGAERGAFFKASRDLKSVTRCERSSARTVLLQR